MTEKDIQKISAEYKDEQELLYEKIHERVENMIVQQACKRKRLQIFCKVFPVALAMVLIASLLVALPIVLQPTDDEIRYSYSSDDLDAIELEYNLKEYARINKENFLYIDIMAEDVTTFRYFMKDDDSVTVYLREDFVDEEFGYSIKLSIMKKDVTVDKFENIFNETKNKAINNVDITYEITKQASKAQFEYQNYKYYLEFGNIDEYFDIEYITAIITNMFETQQATA